MDLNFIVGKEEKERKEERRETRKSRRRQCIQLVIIEDSIDDLSERTFQFFSRSEAFRAIQEKIREWKTYSWSLPLPQTPNYDKFLKAIELQTSVYEVGTLDGCGFHLEIQIKS